MKTVFLYLLTVLSLVSTGLRAEGGDENTRPVYQHSDEEQLAIDTAAVRKARKTLEDKYLGKNVNISHAQNEPMKQYIDWLMAPYEALIKGRIDPKLRIQQIGGPTGTGKSAVSNDLTEMMIEAGLLLQKRTIKRQGGPRHKIELSVINDLRQTVEELNKGASGDNYNDKRTRFVRSNAHVSFDEATHSPPPPPDLEVELEDRLNLIREQYKGKNELPVQRTKVPPKPVKKKNMSDEEYERLVEKRRDALIAEARADAKALQNQAPGFDDAVRAAITRYRRDKADQLISNRLTEEVWSATSGGIYRETEQKEQTENYSKDIVAADKALSDFRGQNRHSELFQALEILEGNIAPRQLALDSLHREKIRVADELEAAKKLRAEFEEIPVNLIEKYLDSNDLADKVKQIDGKKTNIPDWVLEMIDTIRKSEDFLNRNLLGSKPDKTYEPNDVTMELRDFFYRAENKIIERLDASNTRQQARIEQGQKEMQQFRDGSEAFKRVQAERNRKGESRKAREQLITEYHDLRTKYHDAILAGTHAPGAQELITKFFSDMNPEKLKAYAPVYYQELLNVKKDPATFLADLVASGNIDNMFDQWLLMNAEDARAKIRDVVVDTKFFQKEVYLGGISIEMKFNIRSLEAKIRKRVKAAHKQKRRVTWDQLARWYKELLPPQWAEDFLKLHLPGFFDKMMAETEKGEGNDNAKLRRITGENGPLWLGSMDHATMVTSVAGTVLTEFNQWLEGLKKMGYDIDGKLYIHENVPAALLHEELGAERGPATALNPTKADIGSMLDVLQEQLLPRLKAGEKVRFNVAVMSELLRTKEGVKKPMPSLTLRKLPPSPIFNQDDPILTGVPPVLRGEDGEPLPPIHFVNKSIPPDPAFRGLADRTKVDFSPINFKAPPPPPEPVAGGPTNASGPQAVGNHGEVRVVPGIPILKADRDLSDAGLRREMGFSEPETDVERAIDKVLLKTERALHGAKIRANQRDLSDKGLRQELGLLLPVTETDYKNQQEQFRAERSKVIAAYNAEVETIESKSKADQKEINDAETERKRLVAVAAAEAERVADAAAAEATATAEQERARNAEEQRVKALDDKAIELADRFAELEKIVLSQGPHEAELRAFYAKIAAAMAQKERDFFRDHLFQLAQQGRTTMGELFLWLNFERQRRQNVDDYLRAIWKEINALSSRNLRLLFQTLIVDLELKERARKETELGWFGHRMRFAAQKCPYARLYINRDVPPEYRAGIPKSNLFGRNR